MAGYAVWEWESLNVFLPYSSEVSMSLENAKANSLNELPLGTVDPYLEPFKVNIPQMVQITNYNGQSRKVRRLDVSANHPFFKGTKWEWNFHHDTWFPYGTTESGEIQSKYDSNRMPFVLTNLPTYSIDLQAMVQTNTQTQFQRKIRVVTCTPYTCPVGGTQPRASPRATQPRASPRAHVTTRSTPQQPVAQQPAAAVQQPAQSTQQPRLVNSFRGLGVVTPGSGTAASANPQIPSSSRHSAASSSHAPGTTPGNLPESLKSILKSNCKAYTPSAGAADMCSVCKNDITEDSDYDTGPSLPGVALLQITLACQHHIHNQCLYAMISASSDTSSFRCPECQHCYGTRTGNQPANGKMSVKVDDSISLAGFQQYGTIIVTYSFTSGTENGQSYSASNFPRVAYFPNCDKGNDIVDLLKVAFKRRLVFTIGTSVTTGSANCVVWNDIHHKTSMRRGDAYGYPDPGYLDRVVGELKSKGVE